jgi:hypothetical protein
MFKTLTAALLFSSILPYNSFAAGDPARNERAGELGFAEGARIVADQVERMVRSSVAHDDKSPPAPEFELGRVMALKSMLFALRDRFNQLAADPAIPHGSVTRSALSKAAAKLRILGMPNQFPSTKILATQLTYLMNELRNEFKATEAAGTPLRDRIRGASPDADIAHDLALHAMGRAFTDIVNAFRVASPTQSGLEVLTSFARTAGYANLKFDETTGARALNGIASMIEAYAETLMHLKFECTKLLRIPASKQKIMADAQNYLAALSDRPVEVSAPAAPAAEEELVEITIVIESDELGRPLLEKLRLLNSPAPACERVLRGARVHAH